MYKDSDEFEFWPDRTIDFGITCPLVRKKETTHIRPCSEHSLLIFYWNLQITWTGIKAWTSLNSGYIGYLPFSAKKNKKIIRPCPAHTCSLFSFDWIFMKVADNLDRHKILYEFEFRLDHTIHFGVNCPWAPKKPIFDFVRSIACVIFIQSLWNLQINRTGVIRDIKYSRSLKLGHIALYISRFTFELHALDCWYIGSSRWAIVARWATCFWVQSNCMQILANFEQVLLVASGLMQCISVTWQPRSGGGCFTLGNIEG